MTTILQLELYLLGMKNLRASGSHSGTVAGMHSVDLSCTVQGIGKSMRPLRKELTRQNCDLILRTRTSVLNDLR